MEKVLICRKCLSVKPDFLPGIYCEYCGGVLDECEAEINKIQEKKKLLKELYGGGRDEKKKNPYRNYKKIREYIESLDNIDQIGSQLTKKTPNRNTLTWKYIEKVITENGFDKDPELIDKFAEILKQSWKIKKIRLKEEQVQNYILIMCWDLWMRYIKKPLDAMEFAFWFGYSFGKVFNIVIDPPNNKGESKNSPHIIINKMKIKTNLLLKEFLNYCFGKNDVITLTKEELWNFLLEGNKEAIELNKQLVKLLKDNKIKV